MVEGYRRVEPPEWEDLLNRLIEGYQGMPWLQAELQRYIGIGRFTRTQAADIWDYVIGRIGARQTVEVQRERARVSTLRMRGREPVATARVEAARLAKRRAKFPAEPPEARPMYYPFLETMFPAMKRYYEPRFAEIYAEAGMPKKRAAWLERKYAPKEYTEAMEEGGKRVLKERPEEIDPWQRYLQTYPWLSKFYEVPPRERGFFPAEYRPPTRWLGF